MTKYDNLVSIVDRICAEAPTENSRYHTTEGDAVNQARSRAYIHLFLLVKYGLLDFKQREQYITDDPGDGGIDAYYIDEKNKVIYFIQSKFRLSNANFETVDITYDELLSMDINDITSGKQCDVRGNDYNGKIKQLQQKLYALDDIARYEYRIVLLANVQRVEKRLNQLFRPYAVEVYNYERVYSELVYPVVSGTYYNPDTLTIEVNISNQNTTCIECKPTTELGESQVKVLFVPTLEMGKVLHHYKNSILRYNPRSYLGMQSQSVNAKIRKSIIEKTTNEFALYNNGITMLADSAQYNNNIGKYGVAKLTITNPQIINGGQTAYTLSQIYEDSVLGNQDDSIFRGKDVLLKVIAINNTQNNQSNRIKFIEEISTATNQQTPVSEADRRANDAIQINLQKLYYDEFGLFYERKLGEFNDGLSKGYLQKENLINREDFIRCCLAANDNPVAARQRSANILFKKKEFDAILNDTSNYNKYIYSWMILKSLDKSKMVGESLKLYARYAIVCVVTHSYFDQLDKNQYEQTINMDLDRVMGKWEEFEQFVRNQEENQKYYFKAKIDPTTQEKTVDANWQGYYKGRTLFKDLKNFFQL